MEIEINRLYTLPEVAEITGQKVSNLRYWAKRGQIRAVKTGRAWTLTGVALKHFIEHGTDAKRETEVQTKEKDGGI